jgi:hypothetical protein
LAVLAASRCLQTNYGEIRWLVALVLALGYSILLRPDGGLLAAAILAYLFWHAPKRVGAMRTMAKLFAVSALTLLPLLPWTIRNYRVFHVIQPLAPRYANDPGELPESGYKSWTKTWFGDAVSNEEFYWCSDDCPLNISLLPNRAFDSAEQRQRTAALLDDVNDGVAITPALDAQFAALAAERNAGHPLRSHVGLPLLRLADMLLRPRTELFPMPSRWWEWRLHPRLSFVALALAALNLAYLVLAAAAFLRRKVPLATMLLAYVLLRCLLLLTLENAEPRYTLELFPIVIAASAFATTSSGRSSSLSS